MPAVPAWPPSSLPRLFVDTTLAAGAAVELDGPPAHYLANVLRLKPGDPVKLFDDKTGEWLARVGDLGRRRVALAVEDRLRAREAPADLWLLFAPIKRGRIDWLVEKATELGVARLIPVLTARTIVDRVNLDRLRAHVIEAAEQCERTALPRLDAPERLDRALADWPADRPLLFADENGGAPFADVVAAGPAAILIGPEGGFIDAERDALSSVEAARPVSLGANILRADTAALVAIAGWMALSGQWRPRSEGR